MNNLNVLSGYSHISYSKSSYDRIIIFLMVLFCVVPVNYYVGPLNFPRILALLIIFIFFVLKRNMNIKRLGRNNILFWLYIILHVVQIICVGNFIQAFAYFVSYFIVAYIGIHVLQNEDNLYRFIDYLILCSFILSLLGLIEAFSGRYLIQGELLDAQDGMRYGILRCTATFGHPIAFGTFQAIVALMAFYRITTNISRQKKRRLIILYCFIVLSCFLTVSRLAICMYIAGQILSLWKIGISKFLKYVFLVIFLFIFVVIIFECLGIDFFTSLVSDFISGIQSLFGINNSAQTNGNAIGFGNRLDLYSWVIDDVGDSWLFGKGADAEFAYEMYEWFTKTSIEVQYLNIYFHFGTVGLVSLIISYIANIIYFVKNKRKSLQTEKKLQLNTVLLIIFVVYYIVLFGVQETDTLSIYCLLVSVGIAYINIERGAVKHEK